MGDHFSPEGAMPTSGDEQPPGATQPTKRGETERRKAVIASGATDTARWSDPAQLEAAWNARAAIAATYVPAGARVLDLGCGAMALEAKLPTGCSYIPCDLVARDARTIVCEFNRGEFPDATEADLIAALGVLEYIYDAPAFLKRLAARRCPVILSYCPRDFSQHADRGALGWVNAFSIEQLSQMLRAAGFSIRRCDQIDALQAIFSLSPEPRATRAEKHVVVISYNNIGNFGDRLGFHLLNQIMPAHARLSWMNFRPWAPPPEPADLVILGIGNSLFNELMTPTLFEFMRAVPRRLGIFGTQYRALIPEAPMRELIAMLDVWHARYAEDVLLFGRGQSNVRHLGDWLIHAFPMAKGTNERRLLVDDNILKDHPLDRVIQQIQGYRSVFSERLHPLLGALTSAEEVGYREQRKLAGAGASGKFRSMLLDIFGRDYPEETMWPVDRAAVIAYKTQVARNIEALARDLARLLD
jgi:hypothetical protein